MIKTTYRVKYPTKRFKNKQQADELKKSVRKSKEWYQLRDSIYDRQEGKDFLTGKSLRRGWALHHLCLNPDEYDNLDESRFVAVNQTTHQLLHTLFDLRNDLSIKQVYNTIMKMVELTENK